MKAKALNKSSSGLNKSLNAGRYTPSEMNENTTMDGKLNTTNHIDQSYNLNMNDFSDILNSGIISNT